MIMGWQYLWILAAAAAVLCAVGFYKFVYFLSIGYGFAVAGIGAVMMILFAPTMQPVSFIQCALFILYGARLSGFLLVREIKNAAYRKTLTEATTSEKPMPVFVKAAIWISVSALYVAQTSPVFYRVYNGASDVVLPYIGAAISFVALLIETLADKQKSDQKTQNPDMVATKGLYRMVRCPNYFGEILFWTGVFVSGLTVLNHWGQLVMAAIGYLAIVLIMFNGAQRLEKRQNSRYGNMPEYMEYVKKTPIILPLVPLYRLAKDGKEQKK